MRLADIDEKEWSRQVYNLAKTLGFLRYHTYRSKLSQPGFPDDVLVRERVIFMELKRESGKVSDAQREWIRALHKAGAEVYVVRPRHLDELGIVMPRRSRPESSQIPLLMQELALYLDPS
jgi:hypothetical protein